MGLGPDWEWGTFWLESVRDFVITVVAFMLAYLAALQIFKREKGVADEARQRGDLNRMEDHDRDVQQTMQDREHMAMALLYKLALRGRAVHEHAIDLLSEGMSREPIDASDWKRLRDDFSIWQVDALAFIPEYADTEAGRLAEPFTSRGCQVFWLLTQTEPQHVAAQTAREDFDQQARVVQQRLGSLSGIDILQPQDMDERVSKVTPKQG